MNLVAVRGQSWGTVQDRAGNVIVGDLASINTTVYTDAGGLTEQADDVFLTDANGQLPGFVDEGDHTLTVHHATGAIDYPAPTLSGTLPARLASEAISRAEADETLSEAIATLSSTVESGSAELVTLAPVTSARNVIQPASPNASALVLKMAPAQVANILEAQVSDGVSVFAVRPNGALNLALDTWHAGSDLSNRLYFSAGIGNYYAGLSHSFQSPGGDLLASVTPAGEVLAKSDLYAGGYVRSRNNEANAVILGYDGGSDAAAISFGAAWDATIKRTAANELTIPDRLVQISPAAGSVPSVVQGAVTQFADLAQWQDSAGTLLGHVDAAAGLWAPYVIADALQFIGGQRIFRHVDDGLFYTNSTPNGGHTFRGTSGTDILRLSEAAIALGAAAGSLGFFGAGGTTRQGLPALATDPASTMALVNSIRVALIAYGLAT